MSLGRSKSGRPHLVCDVEGCGRRYYVRAPGETIVQLRLRASVNGWRRAPGRAGEICYVHKQSVIAVVRNVSTSERFVIALGRLRLAARRAS